MDDHATDIKKDNMNLHRTQNVMPASWYKYKEEMKHTKMRETPAQISVAHHPVENMVSPNSVLSDLSPAQSMKNHSVFKKPQKQNKKKSVHRMHMNEYRHVQIELDDEQLEEGTESLSSSSSSDSSSSSESESTRSTSSSSDEEEKDGENTTTALNVDDMVGNMVMIMSKPVHAKN